MTHESDQAEQQRPKIAFYKSKDASQRRARVMNKPKFATFSCGAGLVPSAHIPLDPGGEADR